VNTLTPGETLRKRSGLLNQLEGMLGGREAEETLSALGRFLRKEEKPWEPNPRQKEWVLVGQETVRGEPPFVVADHFVVNTSSRALVKIGYMNKAFKDQFLGMIDEGVGEWHFSAYSLRGGPRKFSSAHHSLVDVGGRRCASLAGIWALLCKQRNGETEGSLVVLPQCQNVFFAYGNDRNIWAVVLTWGYCESETNTRATAVYEFHHSPWGIYAFPLRQAVGYQDRVFSVAE